MAGMIVTWLQNTEKFSMPVGRGPLHGERGGRRRRLEPDGVEDHLLVGVLAGDAQGVERRVHDAHVGPAGLGVEEAAVAAGDADHVAEAGEDDVVVFGDGDAVVDPAHGDHAHRAPGTVHQLDALGQVVVHAVAVDGVGVTAAHLHDLVVAAGLDQLGDLAATARAASSGSRNSSTNFMRDRPLVSVRARAMATAAWTSSRSPTADGADQVGGHHLDRAVVVATVGIAASRRRATTVSGTATSPQVMQPPSSAGHGVSRSRRHSILDSLRATSSSS